MERLKKIPYLKKIMRIDRYCWLLALMLIPIGLTGQITLIPDPIFETYLIDFGYDTDGTVNGQVWTADIEDVEVLVFDTTAINDLTGIEDFASLEDLYIFDAFNLSAINLSENLGLVRLDLLFIDNLTELDLSNSASIVDIGISNVPLQSIDLSNNIELESVILNNVPLSTIDLNQINLLDQFAMFNCSNISELDLSLNETLRSFTIRENDNLESINLKNANNENVTILWIENNPNLACLQVDDPAAVIAGTTPPYDSWIIEDNPTISTDCFLGSEDFEANGIFIYPNPVQEQLYIQNQGVLLIVSLQLYDALGRMVQSKKHNLEQIDMAHLNKGMYFLVIATDKGSLTQKIIKD